MKCLNDHRDSHNALFFHSIVLQNLNTVDYCWNFAVNWHQRLSAHARVEADARQFKIIGDTKLFSPEHMGLTQGQKR